jgi:hypothetical protein
VCVVAIADAADGGLDPGLGEALGVCDRRIGRRIAVMKETAAINGSRVAAGRPIRKRRTTIHESRRPVDAATRRRHCGCRAVADNGYRTRLEIKPQSGALPRNPGGTITEGRRAIVIALIPRRNQRQSAPRLRQM